MATIDDLTTTAQAVAQAVSDLIAKAEADKALVPDFQPTIDTLNAAAAAAQAYVAQ